MASADPKHRATVRDVIERSYRSGADCRMPGQQIGDAERHLGPLRSTRNHRCRDPGIHGVSWRVGDADHCVAIAVRALGELFTEVKSVGPEEEPDLHQKAAFDITSARRVRADYFMPLTATMLNFAYFSPILSAA